MSQSQQSTGDSKHASSAKRYKTSSLPFGQNMTLASISGPTYLTAQTLVQQVAYSLSDKIFAYSPESFDLDTGARSWQEQGEENAFGDVTDVRSLDTRIGAGALALGYMFYPDFDISKKDRPQSIIASSASLRHLRASLDELSLLYHASRPVALQIAAVDYAPTSKAGLVTDYTTSLALAEELGFGLIASKSAYEMQHMTLLSTLLSNIIPTAHTYDGVNVARETTRVIDVLNVASLKQQYDTVLSAVKEDFSSKRLTPEGKLSKLLNHFNSELGTEYRSFEYYGHNSPTTVAVVFGTVESSLGAQVAEALAKQGMPVGILSVRVYRPFAEDDFVAALPASVQQILVLGQVHDQAGVADSSVTSALYSDVLAAVNFQSMTTGREPQIHDIKYARETVWTVAKFEYLLRRLDSKNGDAVTDTSILSLGDEDTKQYSFWDVDDSQSADAPIMIGELLSANESLNVTVRTGHDNLAQGGVLRTDVRCSSRSIESAYSVTQADVAVVGKDNLLQDFNVLGNIRDGGVLILKSPDWKDDDVEKKLKAPIRKAIAAKHLQLHIVDPATSDKVSEDAELENYLLQLAFLKIAQPDLYETGLKKLQTGGDATEALTKDLETALKQIDVPESWLTLELEADEDLPHPDDLNVNSFDAFEKVEDEPPSLLRTWVTAAKGLAFKEAFGTKSALRPDLPVKTAVITVAERRRLTPDTYDRNIFHIEFDLGTTGLKYAIGESLGIHAENDPAHVEAFITSYGLNAEDVVEVPSRDDANVLENRTIYQALIQNVDIFGRPPKKFYESLADFTDDETERNNLLLLGTGGNQESQLEFKRRAEVDTITYADILEEFPTARPGFHDLVRIVSPMKRREYSIASSQKVTPNSVSLLIVTVNWVDPKGRDRFGQATRYLNGLRVGAPVTVSVKPSVMKLPPKTTQPIIMAGLGTGLAPFRAFVQERAYQKQQGLPIGDVFLYMGSRHQREEYLYGEEWEAYQAAGIITLLGCAFSRDQPKKIYIQDRMRQTLNDIRRAYLRNEGCFYLCGPTWPVPDVQAVLEEAVENESVAEGKKKSGPKEIERLKDELRYVLEVY